MSDDSGSIWSFVGGTVVGAGIYGVADSYGAGSILSGAAGGAAGGATTAALGGGDVGKGALYGGVGGAASGYMLPAGGADSNLGGLGPDLMSPLAAGGVGALGGMMAIPPTTMTDLPSTPGFSPPSAPVTPASQPLMSVGTSKPIAPATIQSEELPIAQRMESTPGEIDLLNRLASERSQASSDNAAQATERYPVSGITTRAQPSPEERFLGIGGGNSKLKPIY